MPRDVDVKLPRGIVRTCLLVVVVISLTVLFLGWGAGYGAVRTLVPGGADMVPLTAVCFLISAASIYLLSRLYEKRESESSRGSLVMKGLIGILILLSTYKIGDYLFGSAVHLDWLGLDPVAVIGEGKPLVRMALMTAIGFWLTGVVLFLTLRSRGRWIPEGGSLLILLIGAFGLSGYLFGGSPMQPYSAMAVHTALNFMLLAVSLTAVQPESWLTRLLTAPYANGVLVRRMFLLAVIGPVVMGAVFVMGLSLGWFDLEAGLGLVCVALASLGCVIVVITGEQLSSIAASLREQSMLVEETGKIGKIGGWEYNPAIDRSTWTPEMATIHGLPGPESVEMETVMALIDPQDRDRVKTAFINTISDAAPYDIQYGMRTLSGESKWVHAQGYPVIEKGEVVLVRGTVQDITKLHETERSVRESESRLRSILELNPEWVKVVDGEGKLTELNHAGLKILEVSNLEEAHRQSLLDYVAPEYREAYRDLHRRVMAGESGELEYDLQGLQGGLKRLVTHAVPLKDAQGRVQAFLGITRDITEQTRQAALAEGQKQVLEMIARGKPAQETMHSLLLHIEASAPDMLCSVLLYDKDAKCLRACAAPRLDPEYVNATDGIKIGEGVGSCGTAAFRAKPVFVEDIASDPLWESVKEFALGFNLRACWSTPILDSMGEVLATFAVYYERPALPTEEHLKLIEMATHTAAICLIRNQAEQELRASEWRFRRVIESIDEIFWMRDAGSGKIVYVSPQYEDVWGLPLTQVYEDGTSWMGHVHPDDRERMEQAVLESEASEGYDETFRIIHPVKGLRWLRSRSYLYRNNNGEIAGRVGVVTDLTDHKHMEEQLFRAQRLESIGTLASGVAHDLNNILAPILVACGMLKDGLEKESDRRMVETLDKSAQRGASIIRKLLDFSRGTEGEIIEVSPLNVVNEICELVRETFPPEVEIEQTVHDELWKLRADPSHLHQILMNLCVNARDAMPSGGRLQIRVYNCDLNRELLLQHPDAKIGRYVLFAVEDSGSGMTSEVQARIFDPFFTTKEVGKGSGLGLASVLGIVKNHHGFVTVESTPGRGTCFRVFIPAIGSKDDHRLPEASEVSTRREPGADKELIMIVDDEASICTTIGSFLRNYRYRVLTAENGRSALAVLQEYGKEVELVVTDMVMPEMDGLGFLEVLQRDYPQIKTIATSGLVDRSQITRSGLNDVDAFLEKPYLGNDLLNEIRRLLPSS